MTPAAPARIRRPRRPEGAPALDLSRWSHLYARGPFALSAPSFAGISGGRTSAMMALLLPSDAVLTFQNTGREHPRTLDFLNELDRALSGRIVWLELRKPRRKGAPPREMEFARVTYETADRSGRPFAELLESLAEYRETKGLGPVAPWARQRLCTAYMKQRVQEHYVDSLGVEDWDSFIGLRADEPERVHRIKAVETTTRRYRAPLHGAAITKADVMEFWSRQPFDLQIEDHQGNCTGCFLKDQGDLSRVLGEPETDAEWWFAMEDRYADFGGRSFEGYRQLAAERETRLAIEAALRSGEAPTNNGPLDARRFRLVTLQEKRRLAGNAPAFSCSCEGSIALAGREDE